MGYNPQNATESTQLPQDTILDGVIVNIEDGKVSDFVNNTENWQGNVDGPAINVNIEVQGTNMNQLFTYRTENGKTTYAPASNLGKYNKKYGKLPEVGDKVKVQTTSEGFGRVKLE